MTETSFVASAWNNGQYLESGSGYGLRIGVRNRVRSFRRGWDDVTLFLQDYDKPTTVKFTPSFWKNCPELRNKDIGCWLIKRGFATWEKGTPPKFRITSKGVRAFDVVNIEQCVQ